MENAIAGIAFAGAGFVFLVMGLGSEKNAEPKSRDLS